MIDPLSALNAVQSAQMGQMGQAGATEMVPFKQIGTMPTDPTAVGEGFNNLIQSGAGALQQAASQAAISNAAPIAISGGGGPSTWGHLAQQMVMSVNNQQQTAAQKVTDVLQGGPTPVHEAMIATEEADLSFQLLAQMRNKVVDAYQQVMQMQV